MSQRDTSNDVNFSRRDLIDWMKRHNYSHQELAEYLGLTNQAVMYWIEGKRKIPEPMGRLFNFFDLRPHLLKEF